MFQLLFPNTPSVVQLLGLAPSSSACESQSLHPDLVNTMASSLSDRKQEAMHQVPVTSGSSSMHESPVVDSSSSLDVTNTASIFTEASKTTQQVIHQEAGGSGDAEDGGCGSHGGDLIMLV